MRGEAPHLSPIPEEIFIQTVFAVSHASGGGDGEILKNFNCNINIHKILYHFSAEISSGSAKFSLFGYYLHILLTFSFKYDIIKLNKLNCVDL